jgi:lambda family phage portal protein
MPGMRAKPAPTQFPASAFDSFYRLNLRAIASALGVAYHSLASDVSDVNYSSARIALLAERDTWTGIQDWLVRELHQPVYEEWVESAALLGRISVAGRQWRAARADIEAARDAVEWQPRRWQWVDPKNEAAAAVVAVRNLHKSPSEVIRELGRDPDTVWREVAGDIAAMRAAGIPEEMIAAVISGAGKQNVESAESGAGGSDEA